jgi:hypothetical protein
LTNKTGNQVLGGPGFSPVLCNRLEACSTWLYYRIRVSKLISGSHYPAGIPRTPEGASKTSMTKNTKLELTWIGKENRPRLESRPRLFVVETHDAKLLCEPKRASEMNDEVVQTKARAAVVWCQRATTHEQKHSGKPWRYLLIPHDAITANKTLQGLEVQNLKDWAPQLKSLVDSSTTQVLVTGSSALRIEQQGRDSLAGRMNTIDVEVSSLADYGEEEQ